MHFFQCKETPHILPGFETNFGLIVTMKIYEVIHSVKRSRHSSVVQRWATGWLIKLFESLQGLGIFLFTTASRLTLGPTQPSIQEVPGAVSLGVKRPGHEADHSPPSSAEVKNVWSYTSTSQYAFMVWC
jgi:hypothetical protein